MDSLGSLVEILLALLLELSDVKLQQGLVQVSDTQIWMSFLEDDFGRVLLDLTDVERGLGVAWVDEGNKSWSVRRQVGLSEDSIVHDVSRGLVEKLADFDTSDLSSIDNRLSLLDSKVPWNTDDELGALQTVQSQS